MNVASRKLYLLAALMALGACSVGPQYQVPDVAPIQLASPQAQAFASADSPLPPAWWTFFDDRQLEQLIATPCDAAMLARAERLVHELVRLGVIDGARQTWIAKSQGARSGLRYDPDMGRDAPLFYTASGHAWLASLDDEQALQMVLRQGIADPDQFGPNAPRSTDELLAYLHRARERGYAWVEETSAIGTSALAAVVRRPQSDEVIGVLSIAGPSARLAQSRLPELATLLLAAVDELSAASQASELFA